VLSLIVVALLIGMVGLVLKAAKPYRMVGQENARLMQTRLRNADYGAKNAALENQIAYLKTPQGIAEEAHQLDYMKPGEKPLMILGLKLADGNPAASSSSSNAPEDYPPTVSPKASALHRFLGHLREL
jgi:cell division protein FtsB